MSFKQVLMSAMFLLAVAGCAHKSEKAACACSKESTHKCESGKCSHEGEAKGGACADCKGH